MNYSDSYSCYEQADAGDQGCVRQRRFDVYIKPLTLVDPETSVFLIYIHPFRP